MNAFLFVSGFVISETKININWGSMGGLTGVHQVQISQASNFTSPFQDEFPASASSYIFENLISETQYYLRARNISSAGVVSDWQNTGPLYTAAESGGRPKRPRNFEAVFYPTFARFTWDFPNAGWEPIDGYVIELSERADFVPVILSFNAVAAATSYVTTNAGNSVAYFARMRAFNQVGFSSYSIIVSPGTAPALSQPTAPNGDFLRDDNGALAITNGDLMVVDSTQQHQKDIVFAHKGWNHFAPLLGVGIQNYLNDTEGVIGLKLAIRNELERDGQIVEKVELQKGAIQIQAVYD